MAASHYSTLKMGRQVVRNGDKFDPSYLVKFLTDWMLTHIGDEDKKIGAYYRESRADGEQG